MQSLHANANYALHVRKKANKQECNFFYKMENLGMGIANGMGLRMSSGTSFCF